VPLVGKILILLGLVPLVFVLLDWQSYGAGLLLPLGSFVLLSVGFILLKKPEYLGLSLI
jgi:hypothetical protein